MYFIDQMFNPETVNPEYYESVRLQIAQYNWEQDKEIRNAVKAIHDLCSAVKKMDPEHQKKAFFACLGQMRTEMNWSLS